MRQIVNARIGRDGRVVGDLNGCTIHKNCVETWRGECLLCARDRQVNRMTAEQRKNEAYHMPHMAEWS
jgi:hypothetical protein